MSQFSKSIENPMLRNAIEVSELVGAIIASPDRPAIYPFVREYLSARPFQWITAQEVVAASGDFFTVGGVGAAMGSLHDEGLVTTLGVVGQGSRRAKWNVG